MSKTQGTPRLREPSRYLRMLFSIAGRNARRPSGLTGAARAIIGSGQYTPQLHVIRDEQIPTVVVHGEKDLIVPFDAALDIADDADGTLYKVPGAYHSWLIADPRHGADALRQLLHGDLGEVVRRAERPQPGKRMPWLRRSYRPRGAGRQARVRTSVRAA